MNHRLAVTLIALLSATVADALVVASDPTGNTSAPTGTNGQPTDPGFANVGSVAGATNTSSGVYLGNGWVLTARHVGAGAFTTAAGVTYGYQSGTAHNIAGTDLTLFRLNTTPSELATLTLCPVSPALGSEVVMIGAGRTAASSTSTGYFVDASGTHGSNSNGTPRWLWDTSDFEGADSYYEGFLTSTSTAVRWGTNTIADYAELASYGHVYGTHFDIDGGTAYEAQAVANDSGGGVFYFDGERWYLSGIMVAVQPLPNQPGGVNSAFDGNWTIIVDLSRYADEINAIIPEPSAYAAALAVATLTACAASRRRKHSARKQGWLRVSDRPTTIRARRSDDAAPALPPLFTHHSA